MEKAAVSPTKKSNNLLLSNIKIRNKTTEDLILINETSPNAMIIKSADVKLGQFGGGGAIERERANVIKATFSLKAGSEYVVDIDDVVYISIFRKINEGRYQVICLNHRMKKRERCEVTALDSIVGEVFSIETMAEFRKAETYDEKESTTPPETNISFSQEIIDVLSKSRTQKNGKPRRKVVVQEVEPLFTRRGYQLTDAIREHIVSVSQTHLDDLHEYIEKILPVLQETVTDTEEDPIPQFETLNISFSQEVISVLSKSRTQKNGKPRKRAVVQEVEPLFKRRGYELTEAIRLHLESISLSDLSDLHEYFRELKIGEE